MGATSRAPPADKGGKNEAHREGRSPKIAKEEQTVATAKAAVLKLVQIYVVVKDP